MLFRYTFRLILIGSAGRKKCVHNLGTLRGSNIQHWYDVYDETPFFVPKEAHEEYKANCQSNKRSDTGVVIETVCDEYTCDHEEARKEGCKVSPKWGYLHEISNETLRRQGNGTNTPFGALAFIHVEIYARKLGP